MFLNERTVLRSGLFEGIKLAAQHQDRPIGLCRFGPTQRVSLVAIAHSLDHVLIYDLVSLQDRLASDGVPMHERQTGGGGGGLPADERLQTGAVTRISIKEQAIESVAVATIVQNGLHKDLLLIGCSRSLMIYDALDREHLFSVNTSSQITSIALTGPLAGAGPAESSRLLFCGGVQKLYAYQMDWGGFASTMTRSTTTTAAAGENPLDKLVSLELSSERTISETVGCLIHGQLGGRLECLVVGTHEHKIKLFTVDSLEQSIQTCRLTLAESAKINCLCAIETIQLSEQHTNRTRPQPEQQQQRRQQLSSLPAVTGHATEPGPAGGPDTRPQMNYFAYGLENGFVGVYRLLAVAAPNTGDVNQSEQDDDLRQLHARQKQQQQVSIVGERLWRHKSKQAPASIELFDMDGDGLDELIVAYKSGRLEIRAPFTGQLIASMRCFRSSGQLVGLAKWSIGPEPGAVAFDEAAPPPQADADETASSPTNNNAQQPTTVQTRRVILIACSSNSSLVAFRPHQAQPHQQLTDYLASNKPGRVQLDSGSVPSASPVSEPLGSADKLTSAPTFGQPQDGAGHQSLLLVQNDDDGDYDDQSRCWPIGCETRQSAELLHDISLARKRQTELRQQLNYLRGELLRKQVAASQMALELMPGGAQQSSLIRLVHCWGFDGTNVSNLCA
jgi:hypothetical protein